MALQGTRKLLATCAGILGLVGFGIAMAIYAPVTIALTTSILTIIGITGLAGYEIQTQGRIDEFVERAYDNAISLYNDDVDAHNAAIDAAIDEVDAVDPNERTT